VLKTRRGRRKRGEEKEPGEEGGGVSIIRIWMEKGKRGDDIMKHIKTWKKKIHLPSSFNQ
jgi:hypothetical protein